VAVEPVAVEPVAVEPVAVEPVAVLTKRNRVPVGTLLVRTDKIPKDRADHNKLAWDVVVATLPATAAVIVEALTAAVKAGGVPAKITPTVYLSYMLRRGALTEAAVAVTEAVTEAEVVALVTPQAS